MILRIWKARTTDSQLGNYIEQVEAVVIPRLRGYRGFCGAEFVTRRLDNQDIEILVITRWDSPEALLRFADGASAWLPREVTDTLLDYDQQSLHFEQLLVVD